MEKIIIPEALPVDQILDDLDQHGFSMIDQVYSQNYIHALSEECLSHLNQFRDAAIQNGIISNIRSDHILWINENLPLAQQHIDTLTYLTTQLNRAFFLGIHEVEAHFACYNAGEFYALHKDNPQGKNGRVISAVYYLHEEWHDDWGGELRLQDKNKNWHIIQPKPNRMTFFQSDLLHEVLKAKHQRLSITAWLRNDNTIF